VAQTILCYLILTEQKHCSPQNAMLHHGTKTGYHIVIQSQGHEVAYSA